MKTSLKKSTWKLTFSLIVLSVIVSCSDQTELERKLSRTEGITEISKLDSDSLYSESYELWFTQHVDHENEKSETFKQRVILNHVGYDRPTVFVIEGYNLYSTQAGELSKLLNANQITVEHRFFDESRPDSIPWEYLTIKQAAVDHHNIIEAFKEIYKGKWISTGISKGGQTTMYHRRFFPDDVDISVPYVAPFNFEREDPRITEHLNTVGTQACRDKILSFQLNLFEKKSELMPLVKEYAKEKDITFSNIGIERAFDLNVLEYNFAFWQWDGNCDSIPSENASIKEIFDHWFATTSISWFGDQKDLTDLLFTYQALTEIGFYDYDITPFANYLDDTVNITFDFKIPDSIKYQYNPESMKDIRDWIEDSGNYFLYIHGENDPWASSAPIPTKNTNSVLMINPNGNHRTRIKSFPEEMKDSIFTILELWTGEEIEKKKSSGSIISEEILEIL